MVGDDLWLWAHVLVVFKIQIPQSSDTLHDMHVVNTSQKVFREVKKGKKEKSDCGDLFIYFYN